MTKTLWQWEAEFIHLIAEMRRTGIKVDTEFCKPRIIKGREICRSIADELGWNPGSPKQLGEFLLNEMGYPVVRRTEKGNPSFDKFAMEEYDEMLEHDGSDLAKQIFRYRGWSKTVSSNYEAYLKLKDRNDILHPNYKVHGTRTGRSSCENPNLQQIPRESIKEWNGDVKHAFIPRNGLFWEVMEALGVKMPQGLSGETVLVDFDFSQIETRLAAAVAGETELLQAFWDDVDVFQVMADRLGWERQDCKTLTYATLYGAGIRRIATIFGIDRASSSDRITEFFGQYPRLKKKSQEATQIAKSQGYIEYWTGRRRHLTKNEAHKAFNSYVQGGAYEIVKRSGIRARDLVPFPMVLTVHDSYVFEIPIEMYTPDTCNEIKRILEAVPESEEMNVPFKVGYKKWGEKE